MAGPRVHATIQEGANNPPHLVLFVDPSLAYIAVHQDSSTDFNR